MRPDTEDAAAARIQQARTLLVDWNVGDLGLLLQGAILIELVEQRLLLDREER